MKKIAEIIIKNLPFHLNGKIFSYLLPQSGECFAEVQRGKKVGVDFGKRKTDGIVLKVRDIEDSDDFSKLKEINFVYPEPPYTPEQIDLAFWLQDISFCKFFDAIGTVLPVSLIPPKRAKKGIEHKPKSCEIILSNRQTEIYEGIEKYLFCESPSCVLLRGITGSGKTQVYLKLIESVIQGGKTALVLVPEISLTPQTQRSFEECFGGDKIAVLHSGLTLALRKNEYLKITDGKASVVIGTRSAVFAPLENIGIVVIDEEHDGSYKSDSTPRYHAREAAKQRVFRHKALLLLCSATPSIESYHYAKKGKYHLFELDERYGKAILPDVSVIDMRLFSAYATMGQAEKPSSLFSPPLMTAIKDTVRDRKQVLILLNRRGYNTYITCTKCRNPLVCPTCLIPLTFHTTDQTLKCHYCDFWSTVPRKCEVCGADAKSLVMLGTGTQRAAIELQAELENIIPDARVLRADSDAFKNRKETEAAFADFRDGKYDIMLGTQMLSKGHNFPLVTLVGVLMIDKILFNADFRAFERTFSLAVQVIGRTGRNDYKGRAIIQTYSPEHFVINAAASQDYVYFFNQEVQTRKITGYPPFSSVYSVVFAVKFTEGKDSNPQNFEQTAYTAASTFIPVFREYSEKEGVEYYIYSPAKMETGRAGGYYRFAVMIKTAFNNKRFRRILNDALQNIHLTFLTEKKHFKDVIIYIDTL